MTGEATPDGDYPTRTSTALVVLATVLAAALVSRASGVSGPALVGGCSAVALAVVVWASGWERHRALGSLLASALLLPVGLGMVATTLGTTLILAGSLFPVPQAADIPTAVIEMLALAMVVVGATTAVFGAATATRGVVDGRSVQRTATTALRTAILPFLLAAVLAVSAALEFLRTEGAGPGLGTILGDFVDTVSELFFQPEVAGPHLPTFVVMVGVALLATQRAVSALPLRELIPRTGEEAELRDAVRRVERGLFLAAVAVLVAFPFVIVVHVVLPPQVLRSTVGPGRYDFVAGVTTAPELRSLAWWLVVGGEAIAGVVWLLRRFVQTSADRIGSTLAPFAASVVIIGFTLLVADAAFTATVAWVAGQLPSTMADQFTTITTDILDVYGPGTVALGAVAMMLSFAAGAASTLWLAIATRYVEARTAGITIASLGLFVTAAFAGVVDVSNAIVLGSLVAAVLVWDAGEFGVTLGQEVGRHASTRRAELVHATGTLAVGGVGAGVALLISERSVGLVDLGVGPVALGLLAVLVGLMALVLALR